MKKVGYIFYFLFFLISCSSSEDSSPPSSTPLPPPSVDTSLYFPEKGSTTWATTSPESLGWNIEKLPELYSFLETNKTRGFIVIKDGKIVLEKYFGKELIGTTDFNKNSNWYWASAGKTITSFLVGIAQQEGKININNSSSDYLGKGWTGLTPTQENQIKVYHQLTMTTGLDGTVSDNDCTDPSCLIYKAPAGTQWYYHNAPYTLLDKIIEISTGKNLNLYTQEKLKETTGMDGTWIKSGYNNVFYSTPRSMARLGLLILNQGKWENQQIMTDKNYFTQMISTSQTLNPSYGYLWWLNGKKSIIFPGSSVSYPTSLAPSAPEDLIAAMGKNGQFLDVIPSKKIIVIRMGESPDASLVPIAFHDQMWSLMNKIIK